MAITLDIPPDLEILLRQAARQQGKDISMVLLDCAIQSLPPHILSELETELLLSIKMPLPPEVRQERDALIETQRRCPLTTEERSRMLELIDQAELDNAERWRRIGLLSQIRGVSFAETAAQWQIR